MTPAEIYTVAPTMILVGATVLGLLIGSFLNVVILRLPVMMQRAWRQECTEYMADPANADVPGGDGPFNLATPASHCPGCKTPIKPWQNVPVISWLALRGKCSKCGVAISKRYPIVEAVTGLLSLLVVLHFGATAQAWMGLLLLWALVALTMIDADTYLLPDSITLPLLWLGLLANLFGLYTDITSAVIGAMAGYLSLWSVYWLFKLATGKEGMGFGDFKLLAALGAWLGWQYLPMVILLSAFVGAAIGIGGIVLMGKDKAKPIPFGPYLAIAGLVAFIWGKPLLAHYLAFMQL